MSMNPITALSEQLQKLINEHGSAAILRDHLALFKDQVVALEKELVVLTKKNAVLESENSTLKAKTDNLQKGNEELRSKIQKYDQRSHGDLLEKIKVDILVFISNREGAYAENIASDLSVGSQVIQFHLEELDKSSYVSNSGVSLMIGGDDSSPVSWYLEQEGRRYLVNNKLIS